MKPNKTAHILGSIARTLLAITFLFSGFVKAVDPLGTVYKIEDYLNAFGGFFTSLLPLASAAAVCLILFEFTLGFCMLFNVRTNITSWLTLLFTLVMTPLTLYIALTNPVSDCGCFGDALVLTNWQTFWKNIILLALVITLLVCRKAIPQLFSWWAEIIITLLGIGIAGTMMLYSYNHLPPLDFRPYKIGNNIPELMEIPEGAPADEYEITLIYAKEGVEQEFTLDNYPKNDPDWTFVNQRSVLVKKGYVPPIHDFSITNMDYEDITYDILESEEPVTLVTMYDLKKTDRKQVDKLRALVEDTHNNLSTIYLLTGSGEADIDAFVQETGLEKNTFCTIDPVTLKTIVRANPGVFVVQNGIIVNKYNLKNKTFSFNP